MLLDVVSWYNTTDGSKPWFSEVHGSFRKFGFSSWKDVERVWMVLLVSIDKLFKDLKKSKP